MKKILITAAALMAFMFAAQTAQAAMVQSEIKVIPYGNGKLIAQGIDCGYGATDCSETVTWDNSGPAPTLSIYPHPTRTGYGITSWGGCDRLPHMNDCRVDFPSSGSRTVIAYFFDIAPPTVWIAGYADTVGETLHLNVEASDNDAVSKVEYLVDDEVIATRTEDYFHSAIDVSEIPEGPHQVKVRAWDENFNSADSPSHMVDFDHTKPEVVLDSPVAFTNAETPQFMFDVPGEQDWWADCTIRKPGEVKELTSCGWGEPYGETVPTEGVWEFVAEVSDVAGNITTVVHSFVVDRTAPTASFVSGPEDGSKMEPGEVAYSWSATDDLEVTQSCSWNGAEAVECDGNATANLGAGVHSLKVVVSDQAGNSTELNRSVAVESPGDPEPGPEPDPDPKPDPDPDTTDRTAPVVKLVAPKQTVRSMRKALKLRVRCDEACAGTVVVRGKRGIRFSGRVYLMKAGVAKLKLRPTAKVRKRLVRATVRNLRSLKPRGMNLTARATLKDRAGNTGKSALKFSVGA